MQLLVVLSGQDLDHLRAARDQFVEVGDVDACHCHVFARATGNGRRSVILTQRYQIRNRALPDAPQGYRHHRQGSETPEAGKGG